jgi:hypothetical protein
VPTKGIRLAFTSLRVIMVVFFINLCDFRYKSQYLASRRIEKPKPRDNAHKVGRIIRKSSEDDLGGRID